MQEHAGCSILLNLTKGCIIFREFLKDYFRRKGDGVGGGGGYWSKLHLFWFKGKD